MAIQLANGSTWTFAAGYGSAVTVTGISNANPGVVSATAHGYTNGDYVELTSGWSKLNSRIFRVAGSATNTFTLEGQDTTSTTLYPAGTGGGTVRKITSFTQLQQILAVSSSGGDQQYETVQFLEADAQQQLATIKSPALLTLTIGDDPTLAGYLLLKVANDDRAVRASMLVQANGQRILYNHTVAIGVVPSLDTNKVMSVNASLALKGDPVRYAT